MTTALAIGAGPILVAHQGGWDEILLIGGPILVIVGLLWVAKRRVDAAAPTAADAESDGDVAADHDR